MYLKGKLLDQLPEYTKNAEESLSKSVKYFHSNFIYKIKYYLKIIHYFGLSIQNINLINFIEYFKKNSNFILNINIFI